MVWFENYQTCPVYFGSFPSYRMIFTFSSVISPSVTLLSNMGLMASIFSLVSATSTTIGKSVDSLKIAGKEI